MAEPGWYPETADPPITRYWDGSTWVAVRVWDGSTWVDPSPAATPAPLQVVPDADAIPSESAVLVDVEDTGPGTDTGLDTRPDLETDADAWAEAREIGIILGIAVVAFLLLLVVAWTVFGHVGT